MLHSQQYIGRIVLVAASIVAAVLGSIHAFSVFLEPLESLFDRPRSTVSLTYSLALVALTFAVLTGPKLFGRWSAASFIFAVCVLAAFGAVMAGLAKSVLGIWVGYSLIFGAANGLGYGFGLQIAAQFNPDGEGFAMGVVTASYALGAMLSPPLFDFAVGARGFETAMFGLAAAILSTGVISAMLLHTVDTRFQSRKQLLESTPMSPHSFQLLWLGYFGGALAGLMIIGHAAGISAALRPDSQTWIAPVIIAAFNLLGSLVVGRLADRFPLRVLLVSLALLTTAALIGLTVLGNLFSLLVGLGFVGFAYGGTITAFPAAITKLFGMRDSAKIYGQVFTAWGCAGLVGPWFAGFLFDWSGGYELSLMMAAVIGLMSAVAVNAFFRTTRSSRDLGAN